MCDEPAPLLDFVRRQDRQCKTFPGLPPPRCNKHAMPRHNTSQHAMPHPGLPLRFLRRFLLSLLPVLLPAAAAAAGGGGPTPSPEGARVYFIAPEPGAVVSGELRVVMGLSGMGVAPAGVDAPNTGHHHLLIDTPLPDLASPVPADDHHRHFGGGQTEAVISLAPGEHTLQLLLGDRLHIPHAPPVYSEVLTITVQ